MTGLLNYFILPIELDGNVSLALKIPVCNIYFQNFVLDIPIFLEVTKGCPDGEKEVAL